MRQYHSFGSFDIDEENVFTNDIVSGGRLSTHNSSLRHAGSQGFLQLKFFDPILDAPVEGLHYLPSGVVKCL
ncbi:hypothetical protein CU098_009185, partial [Rhizopus stolonifer]